jgi:carboxyl-terminal processing protease
MPRWSHLTSFLLGAAVAVAATAQGAGSRPGKRFAALDTFGQVMATIERSYVERVDEQKLVWGASKGMVATLDAHSEFLTPSELAALREDTQGQFGGVGLSIESQDGALTVREVLAGTPAQRAGLLAGDRIVAIDGRPVGDREDAVARLRGPAGSHVVLRIERAGSPARDVSVTRAVIHVKAVELTMLPGGVAHVRLLQFQDRVSDDLAAALAAQAKLAAPRAIVLDLRDDPGGLVDEAVRVADLFLPGGTIVSTRGREGKETDLAEAARGSAWEDLPVVLLVDGGTASAAEIVAGALQDHRRARVVGVRTFGKGSVQSIFPLADGSGLKLTVARYYTPLGRCIQETGIVPDVEALPIEAEAVARARKAATVEREEDLDGHLANEQGKGTRPARAHASPPGSESADYQLSVAAALARSQLPR